MKPLLVLVSLFFLASCSFESKPSPSIIVVAVDSLGFDTVQCDYAREAEKPLGFQQLCEESVRFTHAYTTSTLSQASLTSVLTGKYPQDHSVTDNRKSFLSSQHKSLAETAFEKGYKTYFASGGPPIFRKSGLAQGFEIFEDQYSINQDQIYKPAKDIVSDFIDWERRHKDNSYFSTLFFADLQFPLQPTIDESGRQRSLKFSSQLLEVDESLNQLITHLKKEGRWEKTIFVVLGLNGRSSLGDIFKPLNVYNDNTRVTLFVKPSTKKRDKGIHWTIGQNVSLVHVGKTLSHLMGEEHGELDLREALVKPGLNWPNESFVIIQSDWAQSLGIPSSPQFAIKQSHYMTLLHDDLVTVNTLLDRTEGGLSQVRGSKYREMVRRAEDFIQEQNVKLWKGLESKYLRKYELAQQLWSGNYDKMAMINLLNLYEDNPSDIQISTWLTRKLLDEENWNLLLNLSKDKNLPEARYVALKNMKKPTVSSSCFEELDQNAKSCQDKMFSKLIAYKEEKGRSFLRAYYNYQIDRSVVQQNHANSSQWDINSNKLQEGLLTDMFLSLPENGELKRKVRRETSNM